MTDTVTARSAVDYRRERDRGEMYRTRPNGAVYPAAASNLKTAAEFCAEYVPLSYAVEPIIRSR